MAPSFPPLAFDLFCFSFSFPFTYLSSRSDNSFCLAYYCFQISCLCMFAQAIALSIDNRYYCTFFSFHRFVPYHHTVSMPHTTRHTHTIRCSSIIMHFPTYTDVFRCSYFDISLSCSYHTRAIPFPPFSPSEKETNLQCQILLYVPNCSTTDYTVVTTRMDKE